MISNRDLGFLAFTVVALNRKTKNTRRWSNERSKMKPHLLMNRFFKERAKKVLTIYWS